MKCKSCGREVPDNSFFCNWCGQKLGKQKKAKDEIKVPKPIKRGSRWTIQLRSEGWSFTADTAQECVDRAVAFRRGYLEEHKKVKISVKQCLDKYIADVSNTLSPSTVREYKHCQKNHFSDIADMDILAVPWQKRINSLSAKKKPKTVANIWRLATAAMRYSKITPPDVKLPQVAVADEPFLDYEQIQIFLKEIKDKPVELPALLALHSLRRSEILALTPESIDRKNMLIKVRGAKVRGSDGMVFKETNKNRSSTRDVPIMIPRILELIPETGTEYLIQTHENTIIKRINSACRNAGLPQVGVHGLRRSFASLAYHLKWSERVTMQIGGWSNIGTVHRYYIKLASGDLTEQTESMKEFYSGAGS